METIFSPVHSLSSWHKDFLDGQKSAANESPPGRPHKLRKIQ